MQSKRKVIITADSVCDIPKKLKEVFGIPLIPFYVKTDRGVFYEGSEISGDNIIEYIEKKNEYPEMLPPSADEYAAFFRSLLDKNDSIVHISQSTAATAAYRNALEAAMNIPNVFVVDSKQISSGIAYAVLNAARMAEAGFSAKVIKSETEEIIPLIETCFLVEKSDIIYRSGLISHFANIICDTFHIKLSFAVRKGLFVRERYFLDGVDGYMEQFVHRQFKNATEIDTKMLIITSSGCTVSQIDKVKASIGKYCRFDNIYCVRSSSCIANRCGRGTFGLVYMRK